MQPPRARLRERQRRRTATEIHLAATGLVRERGLAGATVEAIAERAGVSRRTFFNYYATKEDAVLGIAPPTIPEEALARYREDDGTDEFTRWVRLVAAVIRASVLQDTTRRFDLLHDHPELQSRLRQHFTTAEGLIRAALDERVSDQGAPESTRAMIMLAGIVLQFAFADDLATFTSADDAVFDEAITRAVAVFRTAIRDLAL